MNKKLAPLFDNLSLACLLLEPDGENFYVRYVNREFCEIVGRKREDLLGQTLQSVFKTKFVQQETINASLNQTLLTGKPVVFKYSKYEFSKSSKESFWEVLNIPIKSKGKESLEYILHIPWDETSQVVKGRQNNSDNKELGEKIAESKIFIEKINDGLFSLSPQGNFLNVNSGCINILELSSQELKGSSFLPFCAPYQQKIIYNYFLKALGGADQNFEADFISFKGRKMHLEVSLLPMKVGEKIEGVYGIARDVTEKQLSKKIINEQRDQIISNAKKFKALVQESSDLTGILDIEGNYKFVSESSRSILGIPPEDFIGKNAFEFVHPEDKDCVMAAFSHAHPGQQGKIPPFRFKDSSGTWRWLETTVTNLSNDPFVNGIITNSRDISESRRLWCETERQNKVLKEVAWEHAHIIRGPVVRLKVLLNCLENEDFQDWTRDEIVELMKKSTEELDQIILETVRKTENIEIE